MLRGNLSSRPFYNERLVTLAIAGIAVLAVALTAFNAYKVYALSKQRSELKGRISRDTAQAQEIERGAVMLQRSVDRQTLALLAGSTQEANALIDQRTFSWTAFFGIIENTLPLDLRLVAVAPRIEKGDIKVTMTVVGRKSEDVDTFVEALQGTGAFYDVSPRTKERDDDGTYRADVIAYYWPPNQPPSAHKAATPPTGRGRGRP